MNDIHTWLAAPQQATASDSQDWQALLKVPHANSDDSAVREVPDASAASQGAVPKAGFEQPVNATQPAETSDAQSTSAWSCSYTSAHPPPTRTLQHEGASAQDWAVPELCPQHEQLFDADASLDPLAASEQDLDLFLPSLAPSAGPCISLPAGNFKLPAAKLALHQPVGPQAGTRNVPSPPVHYVGLGMSAPCHTFLSRFPHPSHALQR